MCYEQGITGMSFRIWRKKTERAVTRQRMSPPLYHDMTTGNKRPTAWQKLNGLLSFLLTCNGLLAWSDRDHTAGNDVAVEKSKAETCRFVESKNRLSLSQIVALFLSAFVGCRWIRKRFSPHFLAMSLVAKTPWKASIIPRPCSSTK